MAKILCIEDEADVRDDIVDALTDEGHNVLEACDGRQGLEMILAHEPDIIVSDINMPHMNGHDLVKTLRENHPLFADTPFIFLSALAQRENVLEGMSLGADDYLTKPVDFELLVGKIETSLRQVARMHARKDQQLAHMAHYDALTGLPNRVLFRERIEQALQAATADQSFAVLFLDLDRFKCVNDSLGHSVGDELLKTVAGRLGGCIRESDTIARLGGDEFAIIQISSRQPQDSAALAQRIGAAVKEAFNLQHHQVVLDTSIGIALAPRHGADPEILLKNADLALYGAKSEGRGRYCFFEPEMEARMKARRVMETDLRKAVENQEFELYYQPLVNLKENKICGFEALLRWNHPNRGLVAPDEFIPVAEDTGLINQIGEWVLRQACAEAATWPGDINVAVNLSPVQFRSGNLPLLVVNAIAASGLRACRLELEITESVLLLKDEGVLAALHQLRELGVRIAMDDFGTGHSTLTYLQNFPFDKIKIDRSFVSDLSDGDEGIAIVRAVADMAKSLGMVATAEGVETKEQLDIVRSEGCSEIQGYLLSRPKPAEEIARLFLPRNKAKADSAA